MIYRISSVVRVVQQKQGSVIFLELLFTKCLADGQPVKVLNRLNDRQSKLFYTLG